MLEQADMFYNNVPVAMMKKYRISQEELDGTAKLVARVRELYAMQHHTQSQIQVLTQVRLQALETLQAWMRHFMTIAQIALKEQTQQLEALNQKVPS